MAITSELDEASGVLTLRHPERGEIRFRPDAPEDLARFLDWVLPLNPPERAQPVSIFSAGRGMTDSPEPTISILNPASLAELSAKMGQALSQDRWRGNLWIEGAQPWAEFGWIGREIQIGGARLKITERITRCSATTVDPETGRVTAPTLQALQEIMATRILASMPRWWKAGRSRSAMNGDWHEPAIHLCPRTRV